MAVAMPRIPIMRPSLPPAERIVPYLKKIDSSRIYSNFGPLAVSLEERLAAHFGLPAGTVVTVANATLGLALALAAQGAPRGSLCAMPAWTFIASAHAAMMAGLVPYFIDVDDETWAIDAGMVADQIAHAPAAVGAVMAVAPFGRRLDVAAWDSLRSRTGLPVVIDAAAGFDSIIPGESSAVVSLHATKALGVGEGGFVMSTDTSLIRSVRTRANFGFARTRQAATPAVNAKLSEYHAAVGHAALDEWAEARADWMAAARAYRQLLTGSNQVRFQDGFGDTWVAATCVARLAFSATARVERSLAEAEIETRRWWGEGAHAHPATAAFPRTALTATDSLARSTLGLPFWRDLGFAEIERITKIVLAAAGS